jgi:Fe-S oxidoreductase
MNIVISLLTSLIVVLGVYWIYIPLNNIIKHISSGANFQVIGSVTSRLKLVVRMVFLQEKLLQDKVYGFMHFWFLYGFIILGIGHMELAFCGITAFFENYDCTPLLYSNITLMPTGLLRMYEISQDFFALFVFIISIYALYRRIILQQARLMPRSMDAEIILWFIIFLYITFFLYTSFELAFNQYVLFQTDTSWLWFYPISSYLGHAVANLFSIKAIFYMNKIFFLSHLIIFIGFACYVPTSKHMHLIFAGPNIYFSNIDNSYIKTLNNIDFEDEEAEYGINNAKKFSWKDLLNSFACTECGRCNEVCPAHITDKPLKPKKILHDIKESLVNNDEFLINVSKDTSLCGIDTDEIWACTTCGACAEVCPVLIDSVPSSIIEMRRHLVLMEADYYPKELNSVFRSMENQSNPWGVGTDKRADWIDGVDVETINDSNKDEIDYLLFVGCASSTDEKAIKILKKFIHILNNAKISFAILGTKENCCGDPARRMGNEYVYELLAEKNITQFNKYNVKNIITTCPHCYNQLKNEYKSYDVSYNVRHHADFILELIKENKLKLNKNKNIINNMVSTFHDPCYMGRYNQDYDSSRTILKSLDIEVTEMPLHKEKSFCCGAGGGRMFMEEDNSSRINVERINQVKSINATNVITACPFCKTMLTDGKGDSEDIHINDIAEVIYENIK